MRQTLKIDKSKFTRIDPEKIKASNQRIIEAMKKVVKEYKRKDAASRLNASKRIYG